MQEMMTHLKEEGGREITDEEAILNWVHSFYSELYEQPAVSPEDTREQVKVLTLIEHSVSENENLQLLQVPTAEELEETVKNMPSGKSPGEVGLPIEVLRELWKEMGQQVLILAVPSVTSPTRPPSTSRLPFPGIKATQRWNQTVGSTLQNVPMGNQPGEQAKNAPGLIIDGIASRRQKKKMMRHFVRHQVQSKSSIREARHYIRLQENALALPGSLTLRQLKELLKRYSQTSPFNDRLVFPLLKQLGVNVIANLLDGSGNWMRIVTELRTKGLHLDSLQHEAIVTFQSWLSSVRIGPQRLQDSPSWSLKGVDRRWSGWLLISKTWHKLLTLDELIDDLTSKWPSGAYKLTWRERWKKLWGAGGLLHTKTWVWKILHRAFFTGERATRLSMSQELCCRCRQAVETISHLFFECSHSITRWQQLEERARRAEVDFRTTHSMLEAIDEAVATKKKGSSFIFILFSLTNAIWKDRNEWLFCNKTQTTPLNVSLEQARREVESSFNSSSSASRWQKGLLALGEIKKLLEVTDRMMSASASNEHETIEEDHSTISLASTQSEIGNRRRELDREEQIKIALVTSDSSDNSIEHSQSGQP
ncbi:hypothetical protein R1flu_020576 [Riccia fluitans]|uniref:Reverse transcriptase zinc-binding domain-containing protein n=1 Tax=Riccia fluitans TaxID=41844 RepID=A0ABD1ZLW5_9MARC